MLGLGSRRAPSTFFLCALATMLAAGSASARRAGFAASSCSGCHGSDTEAEVSVTASPETFAPGQTVNLTLVIRGGEVGGVYIAEPGIGQLSTDDPNLKLAAEGLTHTSPKSAASGQVSFRFAWRAPSTPGAVHFEVAALAGNGDGRSSGDKSADGVFSFVYGCTGQTYYRDQDGDGYGDDRLRPTFECAGEAPAGFSPNKDDCDDSFAKVFPGAPETCNGKDDDCDVEVDEEAPVQELWPDEDGDGYYASQTGEPMMGCVPLKGYAADPGDCAPRDPARHPGAEETCNLIDDNCNTRVDERLRPQCGVGFCRRESPTCDPLDCRAGTPVPEACNLLDDDCDGFVDNDAACPTGFHCVGGGCVPGSPGEAGAPSGGVAGRASGGAGPAAAGGAPSGGGAAQSGGGLAQPLGGTGVGAQGGDASSSGGTRFAPSAGAPGGPESGASSSGCLLAQGPPRGKALAVALLGMVLLAARRRRRGA